MPTRHWNLHRRAQNSRPCHIKIRRTDHVVRDGERGRVARCRTPCCACHTILATLLRIISLNLTSLWNRWHPSITSRLAGRLPRVQTWSAAAQLVCGRHLPLFSVESILTGLDSLTRVVVIAQCPWPLRSHLPSCFIVRNSSSLVCTVMPTPPARRKPHAARKHQPAHHRDHSERS